MTEDSAYQTIIMMNAELAQHRYNKKVWNWEKLNRNEIHILYGILLDGLNSFRTKSEILKYTYEDFVFFLYKTRNHV